MLNTFRLLPYFLSIVYKILIIIKLLYYYSTSWYLLPISIKIVFLFFTGILKVSMLKFVHLGFLLGIFETVSSPMMKHFLDLMPKVMQRVFLVL